MRVLIHYMNGTSQAALKTQRHRSSCVNSLYERYVTELLNLSYSNVHNGMC